MYRFYPSFLLFVFSLFLTSCQPATEPIYYEVLVIGAGTGATSAAIQSARSGSKTLLVNPLPWLGGMLTAAGVSATDGNHRLPAGLWGEFREQLRDHYGGADSLFTGWVSNTMFEPHVGNRIWKEMAAPLEELDIWFESSFLALRQMEDKRWEVNVRYNGKEEIIVAKILVDGTDLGDIAAKAGVKYDVGMDASAKTGEAMAPEQANDIVQDLTHTIILKDFGIGSDRTIPEPPGYDPAAFTCACQHNCDDEKAHPCQTMLDYGKLPNGKYMINWPIEGNDYYANVIDLDSARQAAAFAEAKNQSLQFVYYIQKELGFTHLGIADDEFPSEDGLALLPYHREGRRIHGEVQLNVNHIMAPYDYTLYRSGIAVGDYPIDHHHDKYEGAPEIDFPKIPSYSIPLGALIPKDVDNLLVADKAISVTNIVNGTSRLQPVIVQIGQVAGLVASMSAKQGISPAQIDVRAVQANLLNHDGYLLPFIDIEPSHPHFAAVQRVGATGLLRGRGVPFQWANQTWFDPDSTVDFTSFLADLQAYASFPPVDSIENELTVGSAIQQVSSIKKLTNSEAPSHDTLVKKINEQWEADWGFTDFSIQRPIRRLELAVILDEYVKAFSSRKINLNGEWQD